MSESLWRSSPYAWLRAAVTLRGRHPSSRATSLVAIRSTCRNVMHAHSNGFSRLTAFRISGACASIFFTLSSSGSLQAISVTPSSPSRLLLRSSSIARLRATQYSHGSGGRYVEASQPRRLVSRANVSSATSSARSLSCRIPRA